LKSKTYESLPYVDFYVHDPKRRHIHKANIRDRILHQAVFRILYPIFDKGFIFDSYSCRINKGTHAAVNRLEKFLIKASKNNRKKVFILKCDVSKFFDSVNHEILKNLIKQKVQDPDSLWLVWEIIDSFKKSPGCGIPLGNVTSQLFANIYLNELDQFIKKDLRIKYYVRYCDDFVILSNNKEDFPKIINQISEFIEFGLKLKLHPDKVFIRSYLEGIDFLGYVLRPHHRLLRTKTKRRMLKKINENNKSSYLGILQHCNGYKILKNL